jgi:hypothetical protein
MSGFFYLQTKLYFILFQHRQETNNFFRLILKQTRNGISIQMFFSFKFHHKLLQNKCLSLHLSTFPAPPNHR